MGQNCRLHVPLLLSRLDSLNMTQSELARRADVSRSTIHRALKGNRLTFENVQAIARTLEVEFDDLIVSEGLAPPLSPWGIVGRQSDMNWIRTRLLATPSKDRIVALHGIPGVGKSSLAAAVAHDGEVRHAFHGQILFASLKDSPEPLDVLESWAAALGIEIAETLVTKEMSNESRTQTLKEFLTARFLDKRILFIIDEVANASDISPLLIAGARSAVLIITPSPTIARLIAPPRNVRRVKCLSPFHASTLFTDLVPEGLIERFSQLKTLITKFGGLPLVLHVAGKLFDRAVTDGRDPLQLVTDIESGAAIMEAPLPVDLTTSHTSTVGTFFKQSLALVPPEQRDQFLRLGVFEPGASFDLDAFASVCDSAAPERDIQLLVDAGLVTPIPSSPATGQREHEPRRFEVQEILGVFARWSLEKDSDPSGPRYRHAKHYAQVLETLESEYRKGDAATFASVSAAKREWRQIIRGHAWTRAYPGRIDFDELCFDYATKAPCLLWILQTRRNYIAWRVAASKAARSLGRPEALASMRVTVAAAKIDLGELDRADEAASQVLTMDPGSVAARDRGIAWYCKGLVFFNRDCFRMAVSCFEKAIDAFETAQIPRSVALTLQCMAMARAGQNDMVRARECFEKALGVQAKLQDPQLDALLSERRARIGGAGESPESKLIAALETFQGLEHTIAVAETRTTLASEHVEQGRPVKAIHMFNQAIRCAASRGLRPIEARARLGLASLLIRIGRVGEGCAHARRAADLFEYMKNEVKKVEAEQLATGMDGSEHSPESGA